MADWPTGPPTAPPPAEPGRRAGGAEYPSRPPEQWPTDGQPVPPWGGPPGGPEPTGGPEPDRAPSRPWPVVAIALVVVCLLALAIVGAGALLSSDDDPDQATDGTDTTLDLGPPDSSAPSVPEAPTMPTMPSIPSIPGEDPAGQARPLADVLPELIAFVEETRGQEFVTEPVVEAEDDAEFERLLAAEQAEDAEDLERDVVADVALGLVPSGFDLLQATTDLGAAAVLGFYDPESDELYVKGEEVTPFVQSVIVHELTHALDDQLHDLTVIDELDERGDESAFGLLALVEGTARVVETAFTDQLDPEDAAALETEQYALGLEQLPAFIDLPPYLLVESQVPYATGSGLVDTLVDAGGMEQVDAAYDEPPTTSEQVLDPTLFLAGEAAVRLAPLEAPAGVEVADEGPFGAADLRLLGVVSNPIAALTDPEAGRLAPVPNFGGGRFVSWTDGGESCISLEAVGDVEAGSAVIKGLLDDWADAAPDAEVGSRPGGNGITVITATSCG